MKGPWVSGPSAGGGGLPPLPPELDPRGNSRQARREARSDSVSAGRDGRAVARSSGRRMGKVLSATLSAALLVYIGYLWLQVHNVDNKVTHITISALGGKSPTGGATRYDIDGKDENLLIVGNDNRSDLTAAEQNLLHTGDAVSLSTDTMMIVHVPGDGSKVTLISLPRDSYVAIPGHGMDKLNSAYSKAYLSSSGDTNAKRAAGAGLLVQTVENLTGLNIDHYVQVGLIGFYRIAKAINGVPVNLCHAVNDTGARNAADGQDGGSGFKMSAGEHVLNAVQSLEFVRQRHYLPNGDLDRTARQRYFLTAAFRKIASAGVLLNPGKLGDLVNAVDKSLYVDSGLKLLDLARQMANLSANNIIGTAIPFEGFSDNTPVGDVEVVDPAKVKAFVRKLIITTNSAYLKAKTVDPSKVTVAVSNDGAKRGAAATASKVLGAQGFSSTVDFAAAGSQTTTTIEYAKGMEAEAKTLAQYVPGASVQLGDVTVLTLRLGMDGVTARAKSTPSSTPSASAATKAPKALDAGCIN